MKTADLAHARWLSIIFAGTLLSAFVFGWCP
jgi:hypothetical protein